MELTDDTLRTLIAQSAVGEADGCKKLYEHLVDKVYTYVTYRTSTAEQATDLTQDVFIDFFKTLSTFTYQSRAQFYAYVFVITKRKLALHYAQTNSQTGKSHEEFDETTMSPLLVTPVDTRGVAFDVQQALQVLDDQTREIVVLHHWSRYTFGEIAALLDMTESAVRVRHHRALQTLATKLTP